MHVLVHSDGEKRCHAGLEEIPTGVPDVDAIWGPVECDGVDGVACHAAAGVEELLRFGSQFREILTVAVGDI